MIGPSGKLMCLRNAKSLGRGLVGVLMYYCEICLPIRMSQATEVVQVKWNDRRLKYLLIYRGRLVVNINQKNSFLSGTDKKGSLEAHFEATTSLQREVIILHQFASFSQPIDWYLLGAT